MTDKNRNWLLKPSSISQAKECIDLVQEEFEVKLKFTQPDFLEHLYDFTEKSQSEALSQSFEALMEMAGKQIKQSLIKKKKEYQ